MTQAKSGVESDDPVADWGPEAGRGLFDASETTATVEVSGHEGTGSLSAEDVGGGERPVAVLAWIAATLEVADGAARGDVPALRARVAAEPLDLLPGGFRATRLARSPDGVGPPDGVGSPDGVGQPLLDPVLADRPEVPPRDSAAGDSAAGDSAAGDSLASARAPAASVHETQRFWAVSFGIVGLLVLVGLVWKAWLG